MKLKYFYHKTVEARPRKDAMLWKKRLRLYDVNTSSAFSASKAFRHLSNSNLKSQFDSIWYRMPSQMALKTSFKCGNLGLPTKTSVLATLMSFACLKMMPSHWCSTSMCSFRSQREKGFSEGQTLSEDVSMLGGVLKDNSQSISNPLALSAKSFCFYRSHLCWFSIYKGEQ